MSGQRQREPSGRARTYVLFAGWACVGLLGAFGVAALLTIGIVLVVAAAVLAALLLWRMAQEWTALFGLGLGAALLVGYIGWLNRGGPGTVCHETSQGGASCTDEWAPWPFFGVAALLAAASLALFGYAEHARRTRAASTYAP